MLYQFEWGRYPEVIHEATLELDSDEQARTMAQELDTAYVFNLPDDRNPDEVYARPYTEVELKQLAMLMFKFD